MSYYFCECPYNDFKSTCILCKETKALLTIIDEIKYRNATLEQVLEIAKKALGK